MTVIHWKSRPEQIARLAVSALLLVIGLACAQPREYEALIARRQQQIDACLKAGGVPFYSDSKLMHLRYCTLPCEASQ